ncbi:MAG: polymer-forming cytoskeletal protein [Candidatus Margulisbacteria bacterium]|nr:polymer-forming cytoskeletal protein [Candidatus Margulisiibacteriota bacterium]
MIFSKKKRYRSDGGIIQTILGSETSFKGTIDSQESIRVEGSFEGQINSQGEVYIGEGSIVKANIYGRRVIVAGEVNGSIEAINGLEITSTGRVYGDITGDRLIVDEGAVYKGNVSMDVITSKRNYEEEKLGKPGR